jgi:hypothetical protein
MVTSVSDEESAWFRKELKRLERENRWLRESLAAADQMLARYDLPTGGWLEADQWT